MEFKTSVAVDSSKESAKSRWAELNTMRQHHLNLMRQCAMLTLPYLLPPENLTVNQQLPRPFQGMGAKCVNNLASKLMMSLFSPNQPYFKFEVDEALINGLEQRDPDIRAKVQKTLNEQENIVQNDIERSGYRAPLFELLKYAIVTGNYLLHQPEGETPTLYRLDQYVVVRDASGTPVEIVLRDQIHISQLPEEIREKYQKNDLTDSTGSHTMGNIDDKPEHLEIYTWIKLEDDKYKHHQELEDGTRMPNQENLWSPKDAPEFLAGRLIAIAGEDYGRSLVEDFLSDFKSLESSYRSLVKGTACLAKLIYLVNPAGMTNIRRLARAQTGDFVSGRQEDISVLSSEKRADFSVGENLINKLENRLAHAFLLTANLTRDAERVTAEEIRLLSAEIEDALGGIYSLLSVELQMPVLKRRVSILTKKNKLPKLTDEDVTPKIVAGIDGLGRGQTLKKIQLLLEALPRLPQEALAEVEWSGILKGIINNLGLDMDMIIKSPQKLQQELQAKQQQAQQTQMQGAITEGIGKTIPAVAKEAVGNPEMIQQALTQSQA